MRWTPIVERGGRKNKLRQRGGRIKKRYKGVEGKEKTKDKGNTGQTPEKAPVGLLDKNHISKKTRGKENSEGLGLKRPL